MWQKIRIVSIAVVAVLFLIVVFQNRESVETKLLFASVTMPHAALLFVTLTLGFAGGVLTAWSILTRGNKRKEAKNGA